MKYTFLERQLESLPPDVTVQQLIKVKQERINRQQTARRKKLRKLVLKVTEIFAWIMFGLISTGLIVCVIAGAMFLSGALS